MNILVCVKQVPDTVDVAMDENHALIRAGVRQMLNPADEAAMAFALGLKAAHGGRVTAMTMGRPEAEGMLRDLAARGADRLILLTDAAFAGADTLATARTLCAAQAKCGPFDLILCGRRASDGETGQVGPMLAALLDVPVVTDAVEMRAEGDRLLVTQLHEHGTTLWDVAMPMVATCCAWSKPLPLPTVFGMRRAKSMQVDRWDRACLRLAVTACGLRGSPTRVVRAYAAPQGLRTCTFTTAQGLMAEGVLR